MKLKNLRSQICCCDSEWNKRSSCFYDDMGIRPNHEVLIPNLNYIGSSNATIYWSIPHFVDVDTKYLGIDTSKLGST